MTQLTNLTREEVQAMIINAGFKEMPNLEEHLFNLLKNKEIQGNGLTESIKAYMNNYILGDVKACFDFLSNNYLYNYKRAIDEGNNNLITITKFYFTDLVWEILTDYAIREAQKNPEHEINTTTGVTGDYYNISYNVMGEGNKSIRTFNTDDIDLAKHVYNVWTNEIKSNIKNKQIYIELNNNGKKIESDVIASNDFDIVADMFQAMA